MSQQVKGGIVVEQKVVGSSALTADHIWSLDRVTAEKDGLRMVSGQPTILTW